MNNPFLDDEEEEVPLLRSLSLPAPTHSESPASSANGTSAAAAATRLPMRLVLSKSSNFTGGEHENEERNETHLRLPGVRTLKLAPKKAAKTCDAAPKRSLVLTHSTANSDNAHHTPWHSQPPIVLAATGWWSLFCNCDSTRLFSDDSFFSSSLAPLAEAPAIAFYATMNTLFEIWRRKDWRPIVLGEAPVFRQKANTAASLPLTKQEIFEQGRQAVVAACARWAESLRVQRLVAQHLLLSMADPESEGREEDEERAGTTKDVFRFEEACPEAVLAATVGLTSTDVPHVGRLPLSSLIQRRPHDGSSTGEEDLYLLPADASPECRDTQVNGRVDEEGSAATVGGVFLATVPTRKRVLLLLWVLDAVWKEPSSASFRLPVTEWEAPGYHKRVRDPVSLLTLYEDVFRGCAAREYSNSAKVTPSDGEPVTPAALTAKTWKKGVFVDYAAVKERLVLLRANSLTYNGDGSTLAQLAAESTNAGVKALRDAQAEEENEEKHVRLLQPSQRAKWAVVDTFQEHAKDTGGRTRAVAPLSLTELKEIFPPTIFPSAAPEKPADRKKDAVALEKKTTDPEDAVAQPNRRSGKKAREKEQPVEKVSGSKRLPLKLVVSASSGVKNGGAPATGAVAGRHEPKAARLKANTKAKTTKQSREKVFWICCDRCSEWRQLPHKIDPLPSFWECVYMGLTCNPQGLAAHAAEAEKKKKAAAAVATTRNSRVKSRKVQRQENRSFADLYVELAGAKTAPDASSSSSSSLDSSSDSDSSSSTSLCGSDDGPRKQKKRAPRQGKKAVPSPEHSVDTKGRKENTARPLLTANELVRLEEQLRVIEAQPVREDPFGLLKQVKEMEARLSK